MEAQSIGELRRSAQGELETTAQPWRKDFSRGYLCALDDVEALNLRGQEQAVEAQVGVFREALDVLAQQVSADVQRGAMPTRTVSSWIEDTVRRLTR